MNAPFGPVKRSELITRMRRLGWTGPIAGTKHEFMVKGRRKVRIPNPHKSKDIGTGLLNTILRQAGISREKWLDY